MVRETEETVHADEKSVVPEKKTEQGDVPSGEADKDNKEGAANETEEKEQEDKVPYLSIRSVAFIWCFGCVWVYLVN